MPTFLERHDFQSIQACAALLKAGGILVYPTETYYAIGCAARNQAAVVDLCAIKQRSPQKPLPLVAANLAQARQTAHMSKIAEALAAHFWPGPLTLVLQAKADLAPPLLNNAGKTAIRVSSNQATAELAAICGCPLVATSANMAGRPPSKRAAGLDQELLAALAGQARPWAIFKDDSGTGKSDAPSTIIEPVPDACGNFALSVLRWGVIDKNTLKSKNFKLLNELQLASACLEKP